MRKVLATIKKHWQFVLVLLTIHLLVANVLNGSAFAQMLSPAPSPVPEPPTTTPAPNTTTTPAPNTTTTPAPNHVVTPVPTETFTSEDYMHQNVAEINQTLSTCKDEDSISGECHTQFIVDQMVAAGACQLGGIPCGARNPEEQSRYYQRSLLGQTAKYTGYLFIPPATSGEYLAYVLNKAEIIPKAYAQGITYSRLLPILPMWKAFRDIAYILLTLVMLAIGVIIAFRAKINPQTVASAENTIPNIIVTLLLITFSFPIAALIIDFMYVIIAASIRIIGAAIPGEPLTEIESAVTDFATGGPLTFLGRILKPIGSILEGGGTGGLIGGAILPIISFIPGVNIAAIPLILGSVLISGLGSSLQGGGFDPLTMLSPLIAILMFILLLFAFFRIFFMLLLAYIQILMFIIFGPIILLLNALPGNNTFSYWWKNIFANMLSFVITAVLIYLGYGLIKLAVETEGFWAPPFIAIRNGGDFISRASSGLIAVGILLSVPTFVKMVKENLGAKPFAQAGPGMLFAPIISSGTQIMGLTGQLYTAGHGIEMLKGLGAKLGIGKK